MAPFILESHATTKHDGGVACQLSSGATFALSSERVGLRQKHAGDSAIAYNFLRDHSTEFADCFGGPGDTLVPLDSEMSKHHLYHACAAYYSSGFREATVLIIDGQGPQNGQCVCNSIWRATQGSIELVALPNSVRGNFNAMSLGHFYSAISALAGMQYLFEEGKTMGLAAHGEASNFIDCLRDFIQVDPSSGYTLDPIFCEAVFHQTYGRDYYGWSNASAEHLNVWRHIIQKRGRPLRQPFEPVSAEDKNIALAGQRILEEMLLNLVRVARQLTGCGPLCLAGGVALNCAANRSIIEAVRPDPVFIFPAAGDDGQAYGKLLWRLNEKGLPTPAFRMPYLGPTYGTQQIDAAVDFAATRCEKVTIHRNLSDDNLIQKTVELLTDRAVIGWFRGRSEIGPRALGHRSILASPTPPKMLDFINSSVKNRESYRPLGPMIASTSVRDMLVLPAEDSPYMLVNAQVAQHVAPRIPAVVHVDGTTRPQTVSEADEPTLALLLKQFERANGVPVLVNTSLNGKGEPLAETPMDAVNVFLKTNLDAVIVQNHAIIRNRKPRYHDFEACNAD